MDFNNVFGIIGIVFKRRYGLKKSWFDLRKYNQSYEILMLIELKKYLNCVAARSKMKKKSVQLRFLGKRTRDGPKNAQV